MSDEKPKFWNGRVYIPVPSSRMALAGLIDAKRAAIKAGKIYDLAGMEACKAKSLAEAANDAVKRAQSLLEAALTVEVSK